MGGRDLFLGKRQQFSGLLDHPTTVERQERAADETSNCALLQ
jgi:hypothetical protein